MKATDLMIGDWVFDAEFDRYKTDQVETIEPERVWLKNGKTYQPIGSIAPIPLDCEIMWKNGFEDYNTTLRESWRKCSDFTARSFEHPMVVNERYVIIKVMFQENSFGVEIHTGKPTEDLRALACDKSATSNMRYVHELQHALRLCGIEKNIEL